MSLDRGTAAASAAARADEIVKELITAKVSIVSSLPESWLPEVLRAVEEAPGITRVPVTREDDGAAVCAGAALAGYRAALICQNAGILLATNGLAAYALHHQLPFLILAVARGGLDDGHVYQAYKGQVTAPVLEAIGLQYHWLDGPGDDHVIGQALNQSWLHRRPVVVLCTRRGLKGAD